MRRSTIVGSCLLALFIGSVTHAQERVRVFLGPPSDTVFAPASGEYADTYEDIRRYYREDQEFQRSIELVEYQDVADLALMVTFRGRVGLLRPKNQVNARLFALGTDYSLDLNGLAGINWGSFSNQAKSLLRQTAQWAAANRDNLPRFRLTEGPRANTIPNPIGGPTTAGLFLPPAADQTPGVRIQFQERRRIPAPIGTRLQYVIATSGFPSNKTYTLTLEMLSGVMTITDVRADQRGSLRSGRVNGRKLDLSRAYFEIHDYTRGEPYTARIVSADGDVRAAAKVFPFPIVAKDGNCLVWAEVSSVEYDKYTVRGLGFPPGADIVVTMDNGTTVGPSAQLTAGPDGRFGQSFTHDGSGEAVVTVVGPSCQTAITYAFGGRGRAIQ